MLPGLMGVFDWTLSGRKYKLAFLLETKTFCVQFVRWTINGE